jgi:hypothetical protein
MRNNFRPGSFVCRLAEEARRALVSRSAAPARALISELDPSMLRDLALVQAAVRGRRL